MVSEIHEKLKSMATKEQKGIHKQALTKLDHKIEDGYDIIEEQKQIEKEAKEARNNAEPVS